MADHSFRHTPFDGTSRPFTTGLKPLDHADWLDATPARDLFLAEKRRLYDKLPGEVFVAEEGTEAAQQEVLDLVRAFVGERFPGLAAANGSFVSPPLLTASLMVEEDLILMRRDDRGWRLAAGSLCFPSSWSLREKFGKPLHLIHEPVPGFGSGTRMAEIINRMFDGLQGQAVIRYNWSIQANAALYHPRMDPLLETGKPSLISKFPDGDVNAHAFIRVERQTLRKLPASRDVLFTIGIQLDPLRLLADHPERRMLAASFAAQLGALDQDQLAYKGLAADRDRLVQMLTAMADEP